MRLTRTTLDLSLPGTDLRKVCFARSAVDVVVVQRNVWLKQYFYLQTTDGVDVMFAPLRWKSTLEAFDRFGWDLRDADSDTPDFF